MERYAVYFAPSPGSALARFGAQWLGWDAEIALPVPQPNAGVFSANELAAFTESPRRYGFHGTLKPPFRLAGGTTYAELREAVAELARQTKPIDIGKLRLKRLQRFLALVPTENVPTLEELAGRCVMDLDHFRAPASLAEIERRRRAKLSARQDQLLLQWGYPYVLEQFRFHLTLTGSLDEADLIRVEDHLSPALEPVLAEPVVLSDLCIFGDPGGGRSCRILARIPFGSG